MRSLCPRRAASPCAGFTLVEVVVAILITALLMTAVTQMLTTTRITRDQIHNHQEKMLAGPAILDLIEADLRALSIYNRAPELTLRVTNRIMSGIDGDNVDFVTTRDSLVAVESRDRWVHADANEVGYRLRPNPSDNDFLEIYRREDFGIDEEPFDGGTYTFLHDRVRAFDVQVFDEDGPDAEPLEEWDAAAGGGLPLRLEITLELEIAPRLVREQFQHLAEDRRLVRYRRVVRLPQSLLLTQNVQPIPRIPVIEPPTPDDQTLGGEEGFGGDGTGGDGDGGTDILGGGGGGGGGGTTPPLGGGGGGR